VLGEILLLLVAIAASAVGLYFALRYGDFYKVGDTEYRREGARDAIRIIIPALIAATAATGLLLSRLTPHGLGRQYHNEVEGLREARKWARTMRAKE
jgi:hypothetical protein